MCGQGLEQKIDETRPPVPARHRKHKTDQRDAEAMGSIDYLRVVIEDPSLATYWGTLVPELLVSVLSGPDGVAPDGWMALANAWSLFVTGGDAHTRSEGQ